MTKPTRIRAKKKPQPFPELASALQKLPATRAGFEGLIADLIEAATGGRLALMSSGDQGGVDGIAPAGGFAPRRAMQAKRYAANTRFDLNHLMGEMDRAQNLFSGIDCWTMASTRTVMGKEQEALTQHAQSKGWGFVCVDWSLSAGLPRLAVLCAAHPEITRRFVKGAKPRAALESLVKEDGFPAALRQVVHDLTAVDVGFEPARAAAAEQIERIFSDPATAQHLAGPSPAFLSKAPPVARPTVTAQISTWWAGEEQALALLSSEGMGKTWAALTSLRAFGEVPGGPLTVVIKSKTAGRYEDGLTAVIAALVETAESAGWSVDQAQRFWRRRLAVWANASQGPPPRILLLVDGLDELDPFDWNGWFAPLLAAPWRPLFRFIVACREDDWRRWARLTDVDEGGLQEFIVPLFRPEERDAFLTNQGVVLEQVSQEVLKSALHPRTAYHLTRLGAEIGDFKRVTREQILLRDFQNRQDIKGGVPDADAFKQIVIRMARAAQQAALSQHAFTATEGEVVGHATALTGYEAARMRRVLSELISGGWCRRKKGAPHSLTFTNEALPLAVGMALADDIQSKPLDQARAEVDRLLEPWGADDLIEPVLRTCATALVTGDADDALCRDILRRWAGLRFHSLAAQDFWRRLHVFRSALFLDLVEAGLVGSHWLGEWGVASLWEDHPDCAPLVEGRLHRWMTRIALPAEVSGVDPGHTARRNRERTRQSRRLAALERAGAGWWRDRIGHEDARRPPVFHLAARTIGLLPRKPFTPILVAWALSSAASGRRQGLAQVAALLRDNPQDWAGTIEALTSAVDGLAAQNTQLGHAAAALLLEATGRPADVVRAETIYPRRRPYARPERSLVVLGGTDGKTVEPGPGWPARDDQIFLGSLVEFASDPQVRLSSTVQTEFDRVVASLQSDEVDLWFTDAAPIIHPLLRWAEATVRGLIRAYIDGGPGPDSAGRRRLYAEIADAVFPMLSGAEAQRAADFIDGQDPAPPSLVSITLRLQSGAFADQLRLLTATDQVLWPEDYDDLLRPPSDESYLDLVKGLDFNQPADKLLPTLKVLVAAREHWTPDGQVDGVGWARAFSHPEEAVRLLAIELAESIGGEAAAQALAATTWTAKGVDPIRAFEGSVVLAGLPDNRLRPLLDRLGPENLLSVYLNRPALKVDAGKALWVWIRDKLEVRRTSHTMGASWYRYSDRDKAFAAFADDHFPDVLTLLQSVWKDETLRSNVLHDDGNGPGWPLLQAIAPQAPDFVKEVWQKAVAKERGFSFGLFNDFPTLLPPGALFDDLRLKMLESVHTDDKLFGLVAALQRKGHFPFLSALISERLGAPRPIDRAWAITLAGFLTPTDEARALWRRVLSKDPGPGWLGDVYGAAQRSFQRATAMRTWFTAVGGAADEAEAWSAWRLCGQVVDDRYFGLLRLPPNPFTDKAARVRWLNFKAGDWTDRRKAARKALGDTWLHGPRYQETINGR